MISIKRLIPEDLSVLFQDKTLYISDFRSITESFNLEVPAVWKYENLLPWIVKSGQVAVNEDFQGNLNSQQKLLCPKNSDPRISVIKRASLSAKEFDFIWTAIPHPDIDKFCQENEITNNYKYSDFLYYNDKLTQKKALGNFTPSWKMLNQIDSLTNLDLKGYFLKRNFGSGGYTVFNQQNFDKDKINHLNEGYHKWYLEKALDGVPMSAQIYKNNRESIIFGLSNQKIKQTNFVGAELLNLFDISNQNILSKIIQVVHTLNDFLKNYKGFYGIDFFYDHQNGELQVIELNVRLTALTVPTLLLNQSNSVLAIFEEDTSIDQEKPPNSQVLLVDQYYGCQDLIIFNE